MSKTVHGETINLFENVQVVNQYNVQPEMAQSKDDIIKARVEPRKAERIRDFCAGRQITTSDYIRHHLELDPVYFDFIDHLNNIRDHLVPLLKRMTKNF